MAWIDYWNELKGYVPKLPAPLAQTLVNRAWRDICQSRLWSFLVTEGGLSSPEVIGSGFVSVTQGSADVVADVTATSLLSAAVTDALNPLVTRQFRVINYGPIYRIADYDGSTGTLTLDRPYIGATNATAGYQVYRCYYAPPTPDFIRYFSIIDCDNGYPLNLRKYPTKRELDRVDPQRGSQDQACFVAHFEFDVVNQTVLHEFWPHPTAVQEFQCLYQRKGLDLSSTNDLPPTIPVDLLMMRAKYRAYEWAEANKGAQKELRGVNWLFLMKQFEETKIKGRMTAYEAAMMKARKMDEEALVRNIVYFKGRGFNYPIDSSFIQQHDVDRMG
jgi:hypothetical protein